MSPRGPTAAAGPADLKDAIWTLPEPESLGASTYVIVLQTDPEGNCGYLPQPDRPRQFRLGRPFGSTRVAFIHTLRTVLLLDPSSLALRGLAAFFDGHLRTFLLGTLWGNWIDDKGHRHREDRPVDQLNSPKFFVSVNDKGDRIRVEFGVKADNIEMFIPSVRKRLRQAGSDYRLALDFTIPAGKFLQAEVVAVDPRTATVTIAHPVEGFPIRWPRVASASSGIPVESTRPAPPTPEGNERRGAARTPTSPPAQSNPTAASPRKPPAPASEPRASTGAYGFSKAASSRRPDASSAKTSGTPPAATDGEPGQEEKAKPKARVAPRLRLKPRKDGGSRTPPPRGKVSRFGDASGDYIPPPPPKSGTSYSFKPGQVSDPLGRKTPFNEAAGPRMGSELPPETAQRKTSAPRASMKGPRDPAQPAPTRPKPLPQTENLSTRELIETIRSEEDAERRWKLIEPNLMMGRAERTYSLIAHFAELLSDRTPEWPAARLRTAFATQPGAVLIGIMDRWHMNQVLPVAEANSESAKIMQWLREREVDRMLRLDLEGEIASAEVARRALRVDRGADEAMIRKTWRILLQFLNADHGRSDEKAIHRQKDEIAKYLQTARDYLLKITFR